MTTVRVELELTPREARDLEAAAYQRGLAVSVNSRGWERVWRPDQTSHWDKLARAIRRAMQPATTAQVEAQA